MHYEQLKNLSALEFWRLTGVDLKLFKEKTAILQEDEDYRRLLGGTKARCLIPSSGDRALVKQFWLFLPPYQGHFVKCFSADGSEFFSHSEISSYFPSIRNFSSSSGVWSYLRKSLRHSLRHFLA